MKSYSKYRQEKLISTHTFQDDTQKKIANTNQSQKYQLQNKTSCQNGAIQAS